MRGAALKSHIIDKAAEKIKQESGLTLKWIARVNGFILIDEKKKSVEFNAKSSEDSIKRGILICVLSVIYMSHGKISSGSFN